MKQTQCFQSLSQNKTNTFVVSDDPYTKNLQHSHHQFAQDKYITPKQLNVQIYETRHTQNSKTE